MRHIKKIADYSMVGGMGAVVMAGLSGCGDSGLPPQQPPQENTFQTAAQRQGAFVVIQEVAPKQYKIVDEYPSSDTRVILKTLDGKEKILTQEELDALIKEEAKKIDEGKSALTNPQVSSGMGGMGLGETILASAAGAILGSWIGSKLFNNQNYQAKRRTSYKSPQTYARSKNSFNKARRTSTKRSGFFGSKKRTTPSSTRSSSRRSSGFFGSRSGGSRSFGG
ncbi:MAG: hypothetical protein DSZ05_03275 [Sulfurospirillum sp.]|nr:MAG: hypothetical protein DSZ05_03275 [Sulfurospirillum sp.]